MSEEQYDPSETLRKYAHHLDSIRTHRCFVRPIYEIMSDALVWPDETPPDTRARLIWSLRPLFHHRTGLILGERWRFEEEWQLGLQLFPRWIGFHPSRCSVSPRLAQIYRASAAKSKKEIDKFFKDSSA